MTPEHTDMTGAARLREALEQAREALHRACLERGSTDGYRVDFDAIGEALAAVPEAPESQDDLLTVTLRRGQWTVLLSAASDYGKRVPLEQGDGGACLDAIREALGERVEEGTER